LGDTSSASEGEEARDVPIADVADWAAAIPMGPDEAAAPAPLVPEEQASPPSPVFPAEELLVEESPLPMEEAPLPIEEVRAETRSPAVEELVPSVVVDPAQITLHPNPPAPSGTKTPPPETPLPVLLLVDQAQSASGVERQELSRRINRWLDQMVLEGGSRHVADWFHHLIESGRLDGLADAAGHSCHETAVRGLISMGFPYALEVRPEDLERIKPREQRRRILKRDKDLKGAAAGVLVGGSIAELVLNLVRDRPPTGLLTVEVGVALLSAVALLFSEPRTPLRNMGLAVLLVASLLSISLAVMGGYAGLVTGLAGLVATLLFALHRS
jgi:hypothetical protein